MQEHSGELETGFTIPTSVDELADLDWKTFEVFALEVVNAAYRGQVEFHHTNFSHDSGRDGEAEYVLGIGCGEGFKTIFRLWLEVKKRTKSNLQKKDIGSHLIDAWVQNVHKIIFVTNTDFASGTQTSLAEFAGRCNLQYQLIDGEELLNIAARLKTLASPVEVEENSPSEEVIISAFFSLQSSPSVIFNNTPKKIALARPDQPIFLIMEIEVPAECSPFTGKIRVKARHTTMEVQRSPPNFGVNEPRLFVPGDRLAVVYTVWPGRTRREWCLDDFDIAIETDRDIPIRFSGTARFANQTLTLEPASIKSHEIIITEVRETLDRQPLEGRLDQVVIVSPPGVGKSHVLGRIRRLVNERRLRELYFDCETVRTDVDLLRAMVRHLIPLPATLLTAEFQAPVEKWFTERGVRPHLARQIAADICGVQNSSATLNHGMRVEILHSLLAKAAEEQNLAVIVEDLHKASVSLMTTLSKLVGLANQARTVQGILVFTSRPGPEISEGKDLWLEEFDILSSVSMVKSLKNPTQLEAYSLLRRTIPTLEEHHCAAIVRQVGTTPFMLREAFLYLLHRGVLREAPQGFLLAKPSSLSALCDSAGIKDASRIRLGLFLRKADGWIEEFLVAGACYGRTFPLAVILKSLDSEVGALKIDRLLETCSRWSVASAAVTNINWIEFDHDLVRHSILSSATRRTHQRLAIALQESLPPETPSSIFCRVAFQAGDGQKCFSAAKQAARTAKQQGRVADVIEYNQLMVTLLDSDKYRLEDLLNITSSSTLFDNILSLCTPPQVARDLSARERHVKLLPILFDSLESLNVVGSGSNSLSEAILTEVRMLAERLEDGLSVARATNLHGRLFFERNQIGRSLALHQEAERMFRGMTETKYRAENLIRMAICYRNLNNKEASLSALQQALKICGHRDPILINKIRNNVGAIFLKEDWSCVRHHWRLQVLHAQRHGLQTRLVHGLTSLAFIDIFEGDIQEGREKSCEAFSVAESLGLDNQLVRILLNMSVCSICEGNFRQAKANLLAAEATALRHRITRRIWRVYANLATVHELLCERDQARARDIQVIEILQASNLPPKIGRQLLPLVNIQFRWTDWPDLLDSFPSDFLDKLRSIEESVAENKISSIPKMLGKYCVKLATGYRFLLTE